MENEGKEVCPKGCGDWFVPGRALGQHKRWCKGVPSGAVVVGRLPDAIPIRKPLAEPVASAVSSEAPTEPKTAPEASAASRRVEKKAKPTDPFDVLRRCVEVIEALGPADRRSTVAYLSARFA